MLASSSRFVVFKVAVLYVGAVIGAGFASGQEILQFFIVFGHDGLRGVLLAASLFCCLGGLVMFLSVSTGTTNYMDFYRTVLGRAPARIMDLLSLVMLPGGVVVMLAGGGAVFSEQLGLSRLLGTLLTALITVAVISKGLQGVISANAVLVPVKVAAILLICLLAMMFAHPSPEKHGPFSVSSHGFRINWAWSALLYVSYNMVVPAAVLSSLGRSVPLRPGVMGGMLGGAVIGTVAFLMVAAGLCFHPRITGYEVPLLFMAGSLGAPLKTALGALIWVAILTTAIADTHGFASRFAGSGSARYKLIGAGAVLFSLPLATLKFSLLVKVLYPLFGYAGLALLGALLFISPAVIFSRRKVV
ncbi:MAG: hypothetical protein K6T66_13665 [Peptococcaceae bacterium]|nr:hypothetical protein [Peptococcaceae bacterium]